MDPYDRQESDHSPPPLQNQILTIVFSFIALHMYVINLLFLLLLFDQFDIHATATKEGF